MDAGKAKEMKDSIIRGDCLRYFSMFSGIGGFELGIQIAFAKRNNRYNQSDKYKKQSESCVGFSEIDKYAIQIYKKHFPEHKGYGDTAKIDWKNIKNFDLLVGGFPCQAFSIAGKRKGFSDMRGTLFFEIARCASEKQPRLLLLENVKGLLSHNKGKTFGVILNTLDELGYDLQWQVLNSKNFGVPQNRERVFIVGHLRGTSRPEVFPLGKFCKTNNENKIQKKIIKEQFGKHQQDCILNIDGLCPTLASNTSFDKWDIEVKNLQIRDGRDNRSCLRSGRVPELGTPDISVRRLTPTECERLQGFPDGWTEGISDTQRYKCLGNAVTVNVIEAIISQIELAGRRLAEGD